MSMYNVNVGQRTGGGDQAKPKAKANAAPKRGVSVPPKNGAGGKAYGPGGRANSVGPQLPTNEEFVKKWRLREVDWTAPVVYLYDDIVGQVQKFGAAKTAGTTGDANYISLVIQVEDEEEGAKAMTYREARQDVLKLTTVRICAEDEKDTVLRERAGDAWQVDARVVPGRSAVSGYSRSRWHPVIIQRSSSDAGTYKQTTKKQTTAIDVEEDTVLKTYGLDLHWGDSPMRKTFQNPTDKDAQSKHFKAWFKRVGGEEVWAMTGDSYNWQWDQIKGDRTLFTGSFRVKKKVALQVVSMSGRMDHSNGAVFYIAPGHWINQCGVPPPKLERVKRRGRAWDRYAYDMSEMAGSLGIAIDEMDGTLSQRWDKQTAKGKVNLSRSWQVDGLPTEWDWQAAHKLLEMSGYRELCVGTSFRKGDTKTWAFWAIQPDGIEDCMEIELMSGKFAYVNPAFGTVTKGRKGAAPKKMGAGGTTIYHATNPLKPKPPKPELVPTEAKGAADVAMKPPEGGSPRRKGAATAEVAAKAMYVPPKIEAEKQTAAGGGKCCFDAFAQMFNYLRGGKEQHITHVEARSAAVQGMKDSKNHWLEGFWEKLTPDSTGEKLQSGLYVDYIELMKKENSRGSILELAVLAKRYRVNIVLFTEGRKHPEFIPSSSDKDRRLKFPTGVMGFQDKHFFWYKFKWIPSAAESEGGRTMEVANLRNMRRGGTSDDGDQSRTGLADGDRGFGNPEGESWAHPRTCHYSRGCSNRCPDHQICYHCSKRACAVHGRATVLGWISLDCRDEDSDPIGRAWKVCETQKGSEGDWVADERRGLSRSNGGTPWSRKITTC